MSLLRLAHPAIAPAGAEAFTDRQAATFLQISRRSVWYLTRSGELPSVSVGRCRRWRRADLLSYLERQAVAMTSSISE